MAAVDKMRIVTIAGDTGGSNQDLTITGFGTPTAAMFFASLATANATVDGISHSIGWTDGTNQYCTGLRHRHGTANEEADGISSTGSVGWLLGTDADPNTGESTFAFSAWTTDGVTISWTTAPAAAYQIVCVLIQCAGAAVGNAVLSATQDVATTITTSIPQDTVFAAFNDNGVLEVDGVFSDLGFGVCHFDGTTYNHTNMGYTGYEGNATGRVVGRVDNDRTPKSAGAGCEVNNFTSTSFDFVTRDFADLPGSVGWLALEWNAPNPVRVAIFDAPTGTATVNKSFTWPGMTPQFVLLGMTRLVDVNTEYDDTTTGSMAIGLFDSAGTEECIAWADEIGAATINTECTHAANAIEYHDNAGTALFDANSANGSMDDYGFTLEFTALPTTGTRKWFGFALQDPPTPPTLAPTLTPAMRW